jgi:hypothetical protein
MGRLASRPNGNLRKRFGKAICGGCGGSRRRDYPMTVTLRQSSSNDWMVAPTEATFRQEPDAARWPSLRLLPLQFGDYI